MKPPSEMTLEELNTTSEATYLEWRRSFMACHEARKAGDRDTEIDEGVKEIRASRILEALSAEIYVRQAATEGFRLVVGSED